MDYKSIMGEIWEKLCRFNLDHPYTPFKREDLIVLIPEAYYHTLLSGCGFGLDVLGGCFTIYGIKCRKSKENKIIIGVE